MRCVLRMVKQKKTNRKDVSVGFYLFPAIPDKNTDELNWYHDGNKTGNLGKTFPGEVFHKESRNIVLSGVPSKFKIRVFLQSILNCPLLVMKRLLTPSVMPNSIDVYGNSVTFKPSILFSPSSIRLNSLSLMCVLIRHLKSN